MKSVSPGHGFVLSFHVIPPIPHMFSQGMSSLYINKGLVSEKCDTASFNVFLVAFFFWSPHWECQLSYVRVFLCIFHFYHLLHNHLFIVVPSCYVLVRKQASQSSQWATGKDLYWRVSVRLLGWKQMTQSNWGSKIVDKGVGLEKQGSDWQEQRVIATPRPEPRGGCTERDACQALQSLITKCPQSVVT